MSKTRKWGVRFSEEGKPVSNDKNVIYDSELNQLKVNTVALPPHLYLLRPLKKMTNLTAGSTSPVATEILFQFKHNLPFKPSVWIYFNISDGPSAATSFIGRYVIDFLRVGATLVYGYADETYVYIKHDFYYAPVFGSPDPQNETGADQFSIRTKFMALNGRFIGQIAKTTP